MMHWLFGGSPSTRESEFWKWFTKNEDMLFHFERNQEPIFDKLSVALNKVHPNLTFEFGPAVNGKREFVISAGGILVAFPAVEALYNAAPPLEKWDIIKFRPRRPPMKITFGDFAVAPEDVSIAIAPDGAKAGVTLYIQNFTKTPNSAYEQAGYLILDQAIGEFDMETKVGYVEFASSDSFSSVPKLSLIEFPSAFDLFVSQPAGLS